MARIFAFAAIVTVMTAGALLLAGAQVNRAEAGDASQRCQVIEVAPDAAYGIAKAHQITICR